MILRRFLQCIKTFTTQPPNIRWFYGRVTPTHGVCILGILLVGFAVVKKPQESHLYGFQRAKHTLNLNLSGFRKDSNFFHLLRWSNAKFRGMCFDICFIFTTVGRKTLKNWFAGNGRSQSKKKTRSKKLRKIFPNKLVSWLLFVLRFLINVPSE